MSHKQRQKFYIRHFLQDVKTNAGFKLYMMKRKINQKKRACKYTYSVTYFNIHNKFFLTFRGNEDWRDPWGHKNRRQQKMKSSDFSSAMRKLAPVKQACSSNSSF